ncbi:MAG: TadE family protein [Acidobacteriota bacterium]
MRVSIDTRRRRSHGPGALVRADNGGALVELAICLPLLVLILVGTADFARVFYTSIALTSAARAAAQAGAYGLGQSDPVAGPMQATANSASNVTPSTVSVSRSCSCVSDDGALTSPMICTDPIATACPPPRHRVMTVTVTTGTTFSTISSLLGVPCRVAVGGCALSRSATMRVSE